MGALKNFNLEQWWNLIVAAGVAITAAAITTQWVPGIPMGLGLVLFGAGESLNHPKHTDIMEAAGIKVTRYPWKPSPYGLSLDALGIGLFGLGLFQVASPP